MVLLGRAAIHLFSHNYNLSAEANGMSGIVHLSHGDPLYPKMDRIPYYIYVYCPFHAYFSAFVAWLFRVSTIRGEVLATRSLSLISFALSLWILWIAVMKPWAISLRAYLFSVMLGASKFADYVTTARNDAFSILLEVTALAMILKWSRTGKWSWFWGGAVCCGLSLFTRQTGVVVFCSVVLWLIMRRDIFRAFLFSAAGLVIAVSWYVCFQKMSGGAMYEHVLLANIRPFKPFDRYLIDFSFLIFCASYIAFGGLVVIGLANIREKWWDPEIKLFLIFLFISTFLPVIGLFRAGGDVNYFFEAIFAGFFFCAMAIDRTFVGKNIEWLRLGFSLQLLFVAVAFGFKANYALRAGFLPYETIEQRVRNELRSYVYIVGKYGAALDVDLWDKAIHGPEVSDASLIVRNAHPKLRAVMGNLDVAIHRGKVSAIVVANENCGEGAGVTLDGHPEFGPRQIWYDWLCVYPFRSSRQKN
jgi:hypothetical protein